MALRFRRSLKLAPGVRLNLSKSGLSLSAGVRGARITAGKRGTYANVGIPGTGIYARERIGGKKPGAGAREPGHAGGPGVTVEFSLNDDGSVELTDESGRPLPASLQRRAKKEARGAIEAWLQKQCEHWNQGIRDILELHLQTPPPRPPADFETRPFDIEEPSPPKPLKPGILDRIVRTRKERLAEENLSRHRKYELEHEEWEGVRKEHERAEEDRAERFGRAQRGHVEAMAAVLHDDLTTLAWPRETQVSFEVDPKGRVWLDVDLPEIEDLPAQEARVSKRGLRILVKSKSDTKRRREYMQHVHAIGFRLAGEVFHLLPTVPEVVISGYSQRPDPSTGNVHDDYLYSVKIPASGWSNINFDNLAALDLPDCFSRFELRRKMTKTGIFKPVEPFHPDQS